MLACIAERGRASGAWALGPVRQIQKARVQAIFGGTFRLIFATVVIAAAGCATFTTGSGQAIAVNTEPEGADCQFTRGEVLVGRVNPTPGVLHIRKEADTISVLCRRDGYLDVAGTVGSEFQPATFGNIILGGLIGVVVDAATGAITKYPEAVTFRLIPHEFKSASERDRFFDGLKTTFLAEYADVVARIREVCTEQTCDTQLNAAEAAREARLTDIERRRLLAKVAQP